jgi:anti-sigma B factor antagonist
MSAGNSDTTLLVAVEDSTAYIRVQGRGTFMCTGAFRQFSDAVVEQHIPRVILDLADCVSMDSAFMGSIAGLALRLRKTLGDSEVLLVNLTARTSRQLKTLGVDRVTTTYTIGSTPRHIQHRLPQGPRQLNPLANGAADARGALEAHETLASLSAENAVRFKDVLTFLREDVAREERGPQ